MIATIMAEQLNSELLQYLVEQEIAPGERLPALTDLSLELDLSVGKLREQLEVARQMGFVSVRPRLGTRREPYNFYPAVCTSLMFGLATGEATFEQFSKLRQTIEASTWHEAVARLTLEDKAYLRQLLADAWDKLRGHPVHIPNGEHRELHLTIFRRLDNPFVQGLLQSYWDAYEATELTRFADYQYWLDVWTYHERIVEAIRDGDYDCGRQLLIEHFQLLPTVTLPASRAER
ncbi:MAG TPA: FCD domain-containing protein [Anaerolineae bacterium]|jgi:DNA-binding FadR family transcriptional regulator|nr:FCD domain-containing protein [Anaerolineae bacterium]